MEDLTPLHLDKLSILSANRKTNEREIREYFIDNWYVITKGLKNTSILFAAGVHGDENGSFGDKTDRFETIIKQVSFHLFFKCRSRICLSYLIIN